MERNEQLRMSVQHCDDVADQLLSLIRPHYKGLRTPGSRPEFKKSMKGEEVENLLLSLHEIVLRMKQKTGTV